MTDKSTPIKKDNLTITKNSLPFPGILASPLKEPPIPNQNLMNQVDNSQKNQNFTFKIIKRRAPWNKKEDEAIIELVNKYGTSNWTIIANEMALLYKSKHRNGKQCRERWHNHLDPIVNKENWTEEEENILFNKHLEYGNKWSDISKFLPGRTDNSIKNHFYSKLRKFIRKILKQINKENLLKNNGIDCYKYNSDKVYKLLKKYKVTYKNVTKDTILDLIISTEKNQKGKLFGISEENKILNNGANLITTGIQPMPNFTFGNTDNSNGQNLSERQSRNSSSNKKVNNKIFYNKKLRAKKVKNSDDINTNNINNINMISHNNKKLFQSSIVPNIKNNLMDNLNNFNMNMNHNIVNINNINIIPNQANILINGITNIPYKRKTKNVQIIQGEKIEFNNENNMNEINQIGNSIKNNISKNSEIKGNKLKKIGKNKTKKKDNSLDNKKLLNKKRRKKKKRKVTISLSTPENKKDQINRIMPGRKFLYGLGHKIEIQGKKTDTSNKKKKLNPEDFNPLINEVEIIREGLEIHSKTTILMDKSLLTEKLFPDRNFVYKPPNLNISIPTSPRGVQFPSKTLPQPFDNKNITVGQPTPMDRFFEPMHSPIGAMPPYMMFPPSTKNVYNVDLGYENNFMRKNIAMPYTPHGYMGGIGGQMMGNNTPNTPKREINMANKIVIQNNNNIAGNEIVEENNDINNLNKSKKPAPLNMEFIENENNDIGGGYPPFFGVGDNIGPLGTKQSLNSPANIFNLSPTSPFIPRFTDKHS